jgi:hypothetical protein
LKAVKNDTFRVSGANTGQISVCYAPCRIEVHGLKEIFKIAGLRREIKPGFPVHGA